LQEGSLAHFAVGYEGGCVLSTQASQVDPDVESMLMLSDFHMWTVDAIQVPWTHPDSLTFMAAWLKIFEVPDAATFSR